MGPLAKRIIVLLMIWVLLVMVFTQVYDNVRGKGAPAQLAALSAGASPTVGADPTVTKLADLQDCVAADPNNVQCVSELAGAYYEAKQWPQAQVNYESAVRLDPHNVALLLKLAGTYIYQQKFEQATSTLQQAAALQPDSPEIHLLLGLSYSKLDPPRSGDAANEWQKVVALAPGSTWAGQAQQYLSGAGK